jgi:hypothetical protein
MRWLAVGLGATHKVKQFVRRISALHACARDCRALVLNGLCLSLTVASWEVGSLAGEA